MRSSSVIAALTGGIAAVTVGLAPAAAEIGILNDISIQYGSARASYVDAEDKLCARQTLNSTRAYAIAYIKRADGSTVASVTDYGGNTAPNCTGNLSIPEDTSYYLQVTDCNPPGVSNPTCVTSGKHQFYS